MKTERRQKLCTALAVACNGRNRAAPRSVKQPLTAENRRSCKIMMIPRLRGWRPSKGKHFIKKTDTNGRKPRSPAAPISARWREMRVLPISLFSLLFYVYTFVLLFHRSISSILWINKRCTFLPATFATLSRRLLHIRR